VSDSAVIICELSATANDARTRAAAVEAWLLACAIITPNTHRDARPPSEFLPVAKARDVAPGLADETARGLANLGVDVLRARMVHHALENNEPPLCPLCQAPAREERLLLIDGWLGGEEPMLACEGCGASTPMGDWTGFFGAYVAEIAVRFSNWPSLTDSFLKELGERLGPRWRVVYARI